MCFICPAQVTDLNGEWKLVYTSNSELTALLALSRLPFVTVGDITQTIDGPSLTVINKVRPWRPGRLRLPIMSLWGVSMLTG